MATSKKRALTARQQKVLEFILSRQRNGQIPPTRGEIRQELQLTSETSVVQFLRCLEKKGMIQIQPGKARGITVVAPLDEHSTQARPDGRPLMIDVPLLGDVQAGLPVDAYLRKGDTISISAAILNLPAQARPFALRARGDSMTGVGIFEGDYVVLDAARQPRSGEVVAALLDGESTLKTYVVDGTRPYLKAANPKYKALKPKRDLVVQGVMVGLVRGSTPVRE